MGTANPKASGANILGAASLSTGSMEETRRETEDHERVRAIARSLESWHDGRSGIEAVAPDLMALLGLEQFATYSVSPGPKHWALDYCAGAGFDVDLRSLLTDFVASWPLRWGAFDAACPEESQRNQVKTFADLGSREWLESLPVYRAWESTGVHKKDQIRVLLCEGDTLLRWVGGYRKEPFTQREAQLLTELVPSLLERVKWERRLGEATLTLSALGAALEAIPAAAFIVRQGTTVVHANRAGQALFDRHQGKLPEELRTTHPSVPDFDITPLEAPGLGPHYLAIHKGLQQDRTGRLQQFSRQWGLTRRQLQVLDLIVRGESNKRMAVELGCSLRTVELHVSNVLKKAHADSRGGLTAKFWGQVS